MGLKAKVLISAGSNMGNREEYLQKALQLLSDAGFTDIVCSSIYQTPPWGFEASTSFYNVCFSGYTDVLPSRFISLLIETEERLGRVRKINGQYASRTIDLDIILWDSLIIHSRELDIPHLRAHERKFVLAPAAEIEPNWVHPVWNMDLKTLLAVCKDDAVVEKLHPLTVPKNLP